MELVMGPERLFVLHSRWLRFATGAWLTLAELAAARESGDGWGCVGRMKHVSHHALADVWRVIVSSVAAMARCDARAEVW